MQDLNDLFYFVKVVEHGGLAPAARALVVPKSKLSRRLAQLEERLGMRLIQRSSRTFHVTDIGQAYFQHCKAMLVEAEAAQDLIDRNRAEPQGTVHLSCPPALLYFNIGDMLARFMVSCPLVEVKMEITNRNVDVLREGMDVALRVRFPPLEDSELVMRIFAISTQRLVAHPRLIEGYQLPLGQTDIGKLPTLGLEGAKRQHRWTLENQSGELQEIDHQPRLVVNDMMGIYAAALAGVGIAPLPLMMVHNELSEGSLVDVTPGWAPRSGIVHAVFPSRRGLLPAVRHLVDFLAEEFARIIDREKGYLAAGEQE